MRVLTSLAFVSVIGCGATADLSDLGPQFDAGTTPTDSGAPDFGAHDATTTDEGLADAGFRGDVGAASDVGTSDSGPNDGGLDLTTEGPPIAVGGTCNPPPLLRLADIPDDRLLDDRDSDTTAIFEVRDGLIFSKFVRDEADARGALRLWQEVSLRIPANQLLDLVQFTVYRDTDPVAIFNRRGNVTTERFGLKIGFSTRNFALNDPDPCAPLQPRRGTFDWSLVHEFGHLRGWVDGSWPAFLQTFPDVSGPGDGYPEDGSPILTGDFVTSYAERADGDEDHAESWTTYVMLADDALPPQQAGEPLAVQKVRWMQSQPGLQELRQAIRITEPSGGNVTVPPAPRLFKPFTLDAPAWLIGTWGGTAETADGPTEVEVRFAADDLVITHRRGGTEVYRESLKDRHASGNYVSVETELLENAQENGQVELLYIVVGNWFRGPRLDLNFLASAQSGPLMPGDVLSVLAQGVGTMGEVALDRR